MISFFEQGLMLEQDDPSTITQEGMGVIFDLFKHFSEGGNVDDFEALSGVEACAMLSVAYADLLRHQEQKRNNPA